MRHLSANARIAIARSLAAAPSSTSLVGVLLVDEDPEVAHAALRTALAISRGGGQLPHAAVANANRIALAALVAHLDARDVAHTTLATHADGTTHARDASHARDVSHARDGSRAHEAGHANPNANANASANANVNVNVNVIAEHVWSACARHELDLALRRCVARVLWAAAVRTASAGRDPALLAATARHLIGGAEPARRRALDLVQELQSGRAEILAVLERWLRAPLPRQTDAAAPRKSDGTARLATFDPSPARLATFDPCFARLATFDPWLARLGAGELYELEPLLVALRKSALFTTVAGPALAALAAGATRREVAGALFREDEAGDSMFVVVGGALRATLPGGAERRLTAGDVVGELAVLSHAPRAATVTAVETATVLEIDRDVFAAAARRAPELVLGLAATLAGWLAPERPDVL